MVKAKEVSQKDPSLHELEGMVTDPEFDASQVVTEQVLPLLDKIREICCAHSIPYYASIVVGRKEGAASIIERACVPGARTPALYRLFHTLARDPRKREAVEKALMVADVMCMLQSMEKGEGDDDSHGPEQPPTGDIPVKES